MDNQHEQGLIRFYSLIAAVAVACLIALVAFANIPGLQDPETGRLPEAASRALMFLPVIFLCGSVLVFAITNRGSR